MNVLVTGATGFIGSELCIALANKNYRVHALCRNTAGNCLPSHKNIQLFKGDILDTPSLAKAMENCSLVYHTAALAKMWVPDKNQFYHVNVTGTKNVMETAFALNVKKVVHTSTCGVWGPTLKHPMSEDDPRITGFPIDYERTKYLAELEVLSFSKKGLNTVIVNPSRVYGEGPVTGSNTVSRIIVSYLKGKWHVNPAKGRQVSNYAYLGDVVQGHILAMEKGLPGNRYILGGEDVSFNRFFYLLEKLSGIRQKLYSISQKHIQLYSYLEAFKTAITGAPPVFLPAFAERLKYDQRYSSNKAINQLGYNITPFTNGFAKTIYHLKHVLHE
ncbi:MAG TPA: NAD-dependent epimerase/dehydratase family protein [Chitinophagaceae bacterium]|nr:NAD-dependent epimerase/dehydratase family protein [Chitinophagaceae bacterium]